MTLAFVFPGQGSQKPGMVKALVDASPAARAVLDEVDAALGENLSHLMFEGPAETLTLTANAQPALMAASLAVVAALAADHGVGVERAGYVAGHSLGEYSALAAAGALSIGDAARVLRARGEAMQAAVPVGVGAMAALLGADEAQAQAACAQGAGAGVCEIANDNAPGQIVISGDVAGVEAAIAAAKDLGVRKAMLLPVSAPFHCSLMAPARDAMAVVLADVSILRPRVPVVANVTARPTDDPDVIRAQLIAQVTGAVRWRESVAWMAGEGGVSRLAELGAGKVLGTMTRRIAPDLDHMTAETPEEIAALAAALHS